jgi:hypothetical protein
VLFDFTHESGEICMPLSDGQQIIKTRDDGEPTTIEVNPESTDPTKSFRLADGVVRTWAKPNEAFGPEKLRGRIEPWLTALVQSEHLALLIGSGLTQAVHLSATGNAAPGMEPAKFGVHDDEIAAEATRTAKLAGRGSGNLEDRVRAASELLRGLEIAALGIAEGSPEQESPKKLREALATVLSTFAASILSGEKGLLDAPKESRERGFNYLVSFLMSFASRAGTRERLQLFTTNYDRYIEAGADIAGLRLIDRFVGSLSPIFRASRLDVDLHYNPPGIRGEPRYLEGVARYTKLHGSVDWIDVDGTIRKVAVPFGASSIEPFLAAHGLQDAGARSLMIYPNAAKDRETASLPYVELFRDMAAGICRPNCTLVTYGYSFGDEHVNRVIEDMLTIPSTHLVAISFGDPLGRIMSSYDKIGRPAQVSLLIGDHVGHLHHLVDHYLPKPAIDRATFRMAELLKARWGSDHGNSPTSESAPSASDGETPS